MSKISGKEFATPTKSSKVAPAKEPRDKIIKASESGRKISSPMNFTHEIHVGFDPDSGEFVGLPDEWKSLLDQSGISMIERSNRPDAVIDVLKMYHELRKKDENDAFSKFTKQSTAPIQAAVDLSLEKRSVVPPRPSHTLSVYSKVTS